MASPAATVLIKNVRINLNEPLAQDSDLLVASSGSNWLNSDLLVHLNRGKNRLWDLIRRVRENYFLTTGSSLSITSATKEFTLPTDFRQLVGIKCTTSGYEYLKFTASNTSDEEWKSRDAVPSGNSQNVDDLLYVIVGNSKIKFADYPPTSLTLSLDYINVLADFTLSASSTIDINDEQCDWLEAYVTKKALMKTPTDLRLPAWDAELDKLTLMVIDSVSGRQIRDAEYVEGYDPN